MRGEERSAKSKDVAAKPAGGFSPSRMSEQ